MKFKLTILLTGCLLVSLLDACCDSEEIILAFVGVDMEVLDPMVTESEVFEFRILTQDSIIGMHRSNSLGIIAPAYGFTCDEIYTWDARIESLMITSPNDFNDDFRANTALNELIEVHQIDGRGGTLPVIGLEEFLADLRNDHSTNGSSLASVRNATFKIPMHPTLERRHRFTIEMITSDGVAFEGQSREVVWQ